MNLAFSFDLRRYFTILIPLNTIDENGGGTEIWSKAVKYSDLVNGQTMQILIDITSRFGLVLEMRLCLTGRLSIGDRRISANSRDTSTMLALHVEVTPTT